MKAFLLAPLFQTDESIRCTVNGTRVKYPCAPVLSGGAVKHARLIIGTDPTPCTSHMGRCIFSFIITQRDDPLREGGWKIIQFGKTNLFLCLSSVFWYTIFWKKCENSKGADPISVTSSANALKEGSWRALCFYRIIPLSKFPDFLLVSINYYDIWENKYWRYLERLEEAFVEIYCDLMEYERYVIEYNSPRDIITYNIA